MAEYKELDNAADAASRLADAAATAANLLRAAKEIERALRDTRDRLNISVAARAKLSVELNDGQKVIREMEARISELEDENQGLRDRLDASPAFKEGDVVGGRESVPDKDRSYYRRDADGVWHEFPGNRRRMLSDGQVREHLLNGKLIRYP